MSRTTLKLLLVAGLAIVLAAPSGASGAIQVIRSSENAEQLGLVKTLKCKLNKKKTVFSAQGGTTNGAYRLSVDIYSFDGFGAEYQVPFGVINPTVDVEGVSSGEDYTNNYPFPGGTPPPSSGAMLFRKKGGQLRIGIYALPNQDYSAGLALAGGAKCDYPGKPKKKKKK